MNRNVNHPLDSFPEYLTSEHLVKLGIFHSADAAYQARSNGNSPSFIKLKHRVIYPKQSVIEFLEQRMRSGSDTTITSCSQENQ